VEEERSKGRNLSDPSYQFREILMAAHAEVIADLVVGWGYEDGGRFVILIVCESVLVSTGCWVSWGFPFFLNFVR